MKRIKIEVRDEDRATWGDDSANWATLKLLKNKMQELIDESRVIPDDCLFKVRVVENYSTVGFYLEGVKWDAPIHIPINEYFGEVYTQEQRVARNRRWRDLVLEGVKEAVWRIEDCFTYHARIKEGVDCRQEVFDEAKAKKCKEGE